jgi:hypothetical protein
MQQVTSFQILTKPVLFLRNLENKMIDYAHATDQKAVKGMGKLR